MPVPLPGSARAVRRCDQRLHGHQCSATLCLLAYKWSCSETARYSPTFIIIALPLRKKLFRWTELPPPPPCFKELPCCRRQPDRAGAASISEELSVAVDNQSSSVHFGTCPLQISPLSFFYYLLSLIFVNLLGCPLAPNLLDVLPPGDLVGFWLNCTFPSRPSQINWISTGHYIRGRRTLRASIGTQTVICSS
jgi:hypothetical protein